MDFDKRRKGERKKKRTAPRSSVIDLPDDPRCKILGHGIREDRCAYIDSFFSKRVNCGLDTLLLNRAATESGHSCDRSTAGSSRKTLTILGTTPSRRNWSSRRRWTHLEDRDVPPLPATRTVDTNREEQLVLVVGRDFGISKFLLRNRHLNNRRITRFLIYDE